MHTKYVVRVEHCGWRTGGDLTGWTWQYGRGLGSNCAASSQLSVEHYWENDHQKYMVISTAVNAAMIVITIGQYPAVVITTDGIMTCGMND